MPINVTKTTTATDKTGAYDPATAFYKILIAALKANAAFMEVAARFCDFSDGATQKPLQATLPADNPDITVVMGAFMLKPYGRNSVTSEIVETYTLVAVTDTLQIATANAIKFAFMGALYHADLENCTWGGAPFVGDFNITSGADGTGGIALPGLSGSPARGVDRLVSIIAVTPTLYVPRASLPA